MKTLISIMLFVISSLAQADAPRNLKKFPLNETEAKAYRASKSFAKELGTKISRRCVNASFDLPSVAKDSVTVQFESMNDEGEVECGDPHYSINVEFDSEGNLVSLSLTEA